MFARCKARQVNCLRSKTGLEDDELQQKQVETSYGNVYMGKYAHLHNLRLLLEIRVKMVIALITTHCWRYVSDRDASHVKAAALSFGERKREKSAARR